MTPVKAVRDESGHWYLVPNELYMEFNKQSNKIEESGYDNDLINSFEELFSQFRTGGDLNLVQLYISSAEKQEL